MRFSLLLLTHLEMFRELQLENGQLKTENCRLKDTVVTFEAQANADSASGRKKGKDKYTLPPGFDESLLPSSPSSIW